MRRRKPPISPAARAREGMRRHRERLARQGRRQVAVSLTEPAISALDALAAKLGLDRSRALDALLQGQVKLSRQKTAKQPQPVDSNDLFGGNE